MKRHHRMLLLAFVLPLIAIGVPYWQAPYNSPDAQLPGAFLGWQLVLVFFAAVASRLSGAHFLAAWVVPASTLPAIVLVDVILDTATDPTTHNLWPLEVLISAAIAGTVALLGALAGHFAIRARRTPSN